MDCSRHLGLAAHARSGLWREWPGAAAAPVIWALREGGGRRSRRGSAALRRDRVVQLVGARGAATGSRHGALGEARGEQRPGATRLTSVGAAQATPRSLHSASSPYTEQRPVGVMGRRQAFRVPAPSPGGSGAQAQARLAGPREEGSVPEGDGVG